MSLDLRTPLSRRSSFAFPLQSPLARRDVIVGGLLLLLPGIGWLLNLGHRILVVNRLLHDESPWPAWTGFADLFRHGSIAFLGMVYYYLPSLPLGFLAWRHGSIALGVLAGLAFLPATLAIPGYMTHYCVAPDQREILHPGRALRRISRETAASSAKALADVTPDLRDTILDTWRTSNRVTVFLVEHLPSELWARAVPGAPRRTIRMIAGHVHNARCMWIKTLGQELGVTVPRSVDRRRVGRRELVPALQRSSRGILRLLTIGCEQGGRIPMASTYTWRNLPLDVGHVLAYFVAHEAHHRGQIVLVARELGYRLPADVTAGLWQWTKRAAEAKQEQR